MNGELCLFDGGGVWNMKCVRVWYLRGWCLRRGDHHPFASLVTCSIDIITLLSQNSLCNRNFGVGGDGVIFALKAPQGELI